ncbi:MAG: hypothetical protein GY834_15955, partial [Bacteroidetes bacterium]|nr:hypothetical protein [Bacteroidota bacterium]
MEKSKNRIIALFLFFTAVIFGCGSNKDSEKLMTQDNPLSRQGTVSFLLHTDKTYSNGVGQEEFEQILFKLPGLADCRLNRTDNSVDIFFLWES